MSDLCKADFDCLAGLEDYPDPFPPPQLSMEEYIDVILENLECIPPYLLERQRQLFDQDKIKLASFRL